MNQDTINAILALNFVHTVGHAYNEKLDGFNWDSPDSEKLGNALFEMTSDLDKMRVEAKAVVKKTMGLDVTDFEDLFLWATGKTDRVFLGELLDILPTGYWTFRILNFLAAFNV